MLTKQAMIREAVTAGHVIPVTGIAYIKATYGVDISYSYYYQTQWLIANPERKAVYAVKYDWPQTLTVVKAQMPDATADEIIKCVNVKTLLPGIAASKLVKLLKIFRE